MSLPLSTGPSTREPTAQHDGNIAADNGQYPPYPRHIHPLDIKANGLLGLPGHFYYYRDGTLAITNI